MENKTRPLSRPDHISFMLIDLQNHRSRPRDPFMLMGYEFFVFVLKSFDSHSNIFILLYHQ